MCLFENSKIKFVKLKLNMKIYMNIHFFRFTNNQSSRFRICVVGYHSCQRGR